MRGGPGLARLLLPRGARVGGRWASLPVSGLGASSLHRVCLSFPGAPLPGRGCACLGDPSPQNPPSVCLFAVCSKLGVLTLVLTVNVTRSILCVPPDTHTPVSPSVRRTLRLADAPPRPHCCCYQHQNKHTHGSHSTWDSCPLSAGAAQLWPQTEVPSAGWMTSGNLIDLFEPSFVNSMLSRTAVITGHRMQPKLR